MYEMIRIMYILFPFFFFCNEIKICIEIIYNEIFLYGMSILIWLQCNIFELLN